MAYRILSLDGGGSWALIQARALGKLYGEQTSGWEILARFQLVAANSGGSLVAGCLAVGMSPADIVASFEDEGWRRLLFHALPWPERHLNPLAWAIGGPRYDTEAKLAGLRKRLGESGDLPLDRLAEAQGRPLPDLLITAFDYDRARALYFRSRPDSRAANFPPSPAPTLAEALHASSTAPVKYFDRPAEVLHRRAWDGGLAGLNNPVLAAVTEAVANGEAPEGLAVLSLGTGSVVLPQVPPPRVARRELGQEREEPSQIKDVGRLALCILDDPPDAATFVAHTLLSRRMPGPGGPPLGSGPVVRMNPLVQPLRDGEGVFQLPVGLDLDAFVALRDLDMDAVEPEQVRLIDRLTDLWLEDQVPNQPIRAGADLGVEIGHRWFGEAKKAWEALA